MRPPGEHLSAAIANWRVICASQASRLWQRGTESAEAVAKRLARAEAELAYGSQPGNFEAVVINDDIEVAYSDLRDFVLEVRFAGRD